MIQEYKTEELIRELLLRIIPSQPAVQQAPDDSPLSAERIKELTGVSRQTLLKWRRDGILKGYSGERGSYDFKLGDVRKAQEMIASAKVAKREARDRLYASLLEEEEEFVVDISRIPGLRMKKEGAR